MVLWRSRSAWCQQVSIVSFLILQSRVEKEKTFFDVLMSKSRIRWKTREPQQIFQDSARPGTKHTLAKSVTPEVILFRMFHTAACSACSLSACRMLMSVLNSLTLHDLHAYNPQPFVHVCPPLAIHTITKYFLSLTHTAMHWLALTTDVQILCYIKQPQESTQLKTSNA